ncbi:DMT family transporter [Saccharopolyspora sp. NPDC000995]
MSGTRGARMDDWIAAGLISFLCGFVVLVAATFVVGAGAAWLAERPHRAAQTRWSAALAVPRGVCGGYLVFTQAMAATALGVAMFTVAVVAGQASSGLVVDRNDRQSVGRRAAARRVAPASGAGISTSTLLGVLLALVAVGVAIMPDRAGWSARRLPR